MRVSVFSGIPEERVAGVGHIVVVGKGWIGRDVRMGGSLAVSGVEK